MLYSVGGQVVLRYRCLTRHKLAQGAGRLEAVGIDHWIIIQDVFKICEPPGRNLETVDSDVEGNDSNGKGDVK